MASIAEAGSAGVAGGVAVEREGVRERESGFPGPTITGICMIVGPLLLVLAALLPIGIYHAAGIDYVRGMAAHHARTALAFNVFVAGWMVFLFALIGLVRRITAVRPWLGRVAGILTLVGLLGPVFFNGVYFGGFQLTGAATQSAAGTMIDQAQIIPSNVINLAGPALVIGFILLAVGAARAGVLSRSRALALGVTAIMPVGFISGYIVIAAVGFLGTTIALLPLGLRLLHGGTEPAHVTAHTP